LHQFIFLFYAGTVRKVLFCALVCCPWYSATQPERGQKAKHNFLFIVYQSHAHQFMAPVNTKIRERDSESIDMVNTSKCPSSFFVIPSYQCLNIIKGWLYAVEAQVFVRGLVRGKSRFIEAINLDSVIYEDVAFSSLKSEMRALRVNSKLVVATFDVEVFRDRIISFRSQYSSF
jgi:hypothetical protein